MRITKAASARYLGTKIRGPIMKLSISQNRIKRCFCIALAVLVMAGFVPVQAKAETFQSTVRIIDLKQNTTVSASEWDSTYYPDTDTYVDTFNYYKITVPANGYIKFNVSNKSTYFCIFNKVSSSWEDRVGEFSGKKTYYCVLPKGVYYLRTEGDNIVNLKWTFTKVASKANYCMAKAQSISAGKTYTLVSKYEYGHYRWYKVKLKSKKKLYVKCKMIETSAMDNMGADFWIYDSHGKYLKTKKSGGDTFRTTTKLPKGTYYIKVQLGYDVCGNNEYLGYMCQLSWSAK